METLKAIRTLIVAFSAGISAGEITLPLVADTPIHRCPCTQNGGVCRCPKDANGNCPCNRLPLLPVVQVAEGPKPKLTPTPILVPDIYVRTENVKVTDGDTIDCDICFPWHVTLKGETIRAGDYDAWESSKKRQSVKVTDDEVRRGKIAADDLRELLKTGTLYLSPLPNEDRDNYGRILATLLLVDNKTQQCVFVSEYMKAHGHCRKESK